jgi:cytochrome c-type protein NapC
MVKISLAGFKDPVRRPRYIIWVGVAAFMMVAVMMVALGVTSSYWFCAEGCHKVQDDSIIAYDASSHSKVSCMACHMPVNADPVTFLLHKMEALGELYLTVTNKYELPLNPHSHVSMEMTSGQCTQCHSENRIITPGAGIIIDHAVHEENEVQCTLCHNRVAHPEDFELVGKDPVTGTTHKHEDFMEMTACFRCHGLDEGAKAPGACSACHPKNFELKPESHLEEGFYPAKHAEMAKEAIAEAEAAAEGHEGEEGSEEGTSSEEGTGTEESEDSTGSSSLGFVEEAYASGGELSEWAAEIPAVGGVFYCGTCHLDTFCANCHGMEMPHPEEFKNETHPEVASTKMDKCDLCHQVTTTGFAFCNDCHHGEKSGWEYDPKTPWQNQHAKAVSANGTDSCLEACHDTKYCYDCHNQLKPVPASHKANDWLRREAEEIGEHADAFKAQPTACEVCHGEGMPNDNAFCRGCHKADMPHEKEFKEFHSKTGKGNPAVCANCHTFKELCSDCHHDGAKDGTPWINVHGGVVNSGGAGSCFEKCHQEKYCVACHTTGNVVPASHNAANWTKRAALDKPAAHPETYSKAQDSCAYCHGSETPDKNKFCMGCHKLPMPHPSGYGAEGKDNGGAHADGFKDKKLDRALCANCHTQAFCDGCHHGYTGATRWVNYHPATVEEDGAQGCFECHEEPYCSYCHVRRAQEFLTD